MREIKFRAWNPTAKTMYQNVMVHGNNIVIAKYNIETDGEDPLIEPMTYNINSKFNWELMQYTGMKDKNGVEIYEGDIVRKPLYGDVIIVWNEGISAFQYAYHAIGKGTSVGGRVTNNIYGHESDKYEVIGNVYEPSQKNEAKPLL